VRTFDALETDIPGAVEKKMRLNAEKYPVELARESSRKYDEPA